jgi:hypothetical protein
MTTTYKLTGNTYPHRDRLIAAGCTYDAATKSWTTDSAELVARIEGRSYYGPRIAKDVKITRIESAE